MKSLPILLKSYLIATIVGAFIIGSGLLMVDLASADDATTTVDVGNATPSVTNVEVDDGAGSITLLPNATTAVDLSATISDSNGCEDVFTDGSISAVFYRSGLGSGCASDATQCYRNLTLVENSSDTCDGGGDTTANASTTVGVWYFADATDASSTAFSAQTWQVAVTATDGSNTSASSTDSAPPDINTLTALNVQASTINFALDSGALAPGSTSTVADIDQSTTTIDNTGNSTIDLDISGDPMISNGNSIPFDDGVNGQKFASSSSGYEQLNNRGTTTITTINLAKTSTSTASSSQDTFWGIKIPDGQATGTYSGTDTITVIWDSTE